MSVDSPSIDDECFFTEPGLSSQAKWRVLSWCWVQYR